MAAGGAEMLKTIGGVEAMASMLRRVRLDRELSHAQVATRIQRPASFIARLETGQVPEPSILTATLLARGCEVSVSLFVAAFALPREDPLPWPREHRPPGHGQQSDVLPGARALGAMLREFRYRRNWSQDDLSARAGLHRSKISRLERGATLSPQLLTITRVGGAFATTTPARMAYIIQLAQAYAGEINVPRLRRLKRDLNEPPAAPD